MKDSYDVIIIGAGLSGLTAGCRLAMFGRDVLILERHNILGGLNSFYRRGKRTFDTGLHAVTNFVRPGVKGTPLGRILRQLRLTRDQLDLSEHRYSRVWFPGVELQFSNDIERLKTSVAQNFPQSVDRFIDLLENMPEYSQLQIDEHFQSARKVLVEKLQDELLVEMLLCPVMCYGCASERDMDWRLFANLFRSIYMEGFFRPYGGILPLLQLLNKKYRKEGGQRLMNAEVEEILVDQNKAYGVALKDGRQLFAQQIFSSCGGAETQLLLKKELRDPKEVPVGKISFVETQSVLNVEPKSLGIDEAVTFFNGSDHFEYRQPDGEVDIISGAVSSPNNYDYGDRQLPEGLIRVTCLANFHRWNQMEEAEYVDRKAYWYDQMLSRASEISDCSEAKLREHIVYQDAFTPKTITRYTGHLEGSLYGSPRKWGDGLTHIDRLYLCGTDHGLVGIIGAMTSGLLMANRHALM